MATSRLLSLYGKEGAPRCRDAPPHQISPIERRTAHTSVKGTETPVARRKVFPQGWLVSIEMNTLTGIPHYLRGSLDEPNTAPKTSVRNLRFNAAPKGPHRLGCTTTIEFMLVSSQGVSSGPATDHKTHYAADFIVFSKHCGSPDGQGRNERGGRLCQDCAPARPRPNWLLPPE